MELPPINAAKVWWTPEGWHAEFPGIPGGHCSYVLISEANIGTLLAVLRARTTASKIGEVGDRTQYQMDKSKLKEQAELFLKNRKAKALTVTVSEGTRDTIRDIIAKLGLAR